MKSPEVIEKFSFGRTSRSHKDLIVSAVVVLAILLIATQPVLSQTEDGKLVKLSFNPDEPDALEEMNIDIEISNNGDIKNRYALRTMVSKSGKVKYDELLLFSLNPGATNSVSLGYTPDDIGEHDIIASLYNADQSVLYDKNIVKFNSVSNIGPFDLEVISVGQRVKIGEEVPVIVRAKNMGVKDVDAKILMEIECDPDPNIISSFVVLVNSSESVEKIVSMKTCDDIGLQTISSSIMLFNKSWISASTQFFVTENVARLSFGPPDSVEVYRGEKNVFDVYVENPTIGDVLNLMMVVEGIPQEWVSIDPAIIRQFEPGQSAVFLVNVDVPDDAELKSYPVMINLGADSLLNRKGSEIQVLQATDSVDTTLPALTEEESELLLRIVVKYKYFIIIFVVVIVIVVIIKLKSREKSYVYKRGIFDKLKSSLRR